MILLTIVLGTIGLLSLDSLWRGTRIGNIVNAVLAILGLLFVAALIVAALTVAQQ